jgi:hypothetical protein
MSRTWRERLNFRGAERRHRGGWGYFACGALALLVVTPASALAATTTGELSTVNCQAEQSLTGSISTSESYFVTVPALSVGLSPTGPMTITVSATVSGQPSGFEVLDTWGSLDVLRSGVASPGPTAFTPPPRGDSSFSFTWISSGRPNGVAHVVRLLWKRESHAGSSTLVNGDIIVTFLTRAC